MERVTPKIVFDFYSSLSNEDKAAFLRLLGSNSSSDVPFDIAEHLPSNEKSRFHHVMLVATLRQIFPHMLRDARRLARDAPGLPDDEFEKKLQEHIDSGIASHDAELAESAIVEFKKKRERQSDPETIRRNIEICDARMKDRHHWSLGRLAGKYKVTKRAISKVLAEEEKWRKLGGELIQE